MLVVSPAFRSHLHYPSPLCSTSRYTEFLALAFLTFVTVPHVMGASVDLESQQNAMPPVQVRLFMSGGLEYGVSADCGMGAIAERT